MFLLTNAMPQYHCKNINQCSRHFFWKIITINELLNYQPIESEKVLFSVLKANAYPKVTIKNIFSQTCAFYLICRLCYSNKNKLLEGLESFLDTR
jgi:hypothetical protein